MQTAHKELTARERAILHQIVNAHIESGEPVGSRTLARLRHLSLSPATIRNVMADLSLTKRYLAQPRIHPPAESRLTIKPSAISARQRSHAWPLPHADLAGESTPACSPLFRWKTA